MKPTDDEAAARFWARMDVDERGCWIWQGSINSGTGYGQVYFGGRTTSVHRVSYELMRGVIPRGLHIDHLCRVRACGNPMHLELVTPRVNALRGEGPSAQNGRKERCKRGHSFDEENTGYKPNGARVCKRCRAMSANEYYYRKGRQGRRDRTGARARTDQVPDRPAEERYA